MSDERRRWAAAGVVCLGQLMVVLDSSIVNVALPVIQHELHFGPAALAWVVNAYLITLSGFMLLAGRVGDLVGRKQVFMVGLVIFTAASAACGLSDSEGMLIAARAVQGVGAAVTSSVIVAIIVTEFPKPRERARAMSIYAVVAVGGGSLGLLAGGLITSALGWHWIFFVNVPIGAVALILGWMLIVERPGAGVGGGADFAGAFLITATLMLAVYALVGASTHGWASIQTVGSACGAVALLGIFVTVEARVAQPLIPLRVFRIRTLAVGNAVRVAFSVAMFGWFFTAALYFERVLHYSPLDTGLAFLPQTILIGLFAFSVTERIIVRSGAAAPTAAGLALSALALVLFSRAPVHAHYLTAILPAMLLGGIGMGMSFVGVLTIAMSGVPAPDAGLASGMIGTSQRMGSAIGVALMATVAASRTHALNHGHETAATLTSGYHLAFLAGAIVVAAAVPLALLLMRRDADEPRASVVPG